MIMTHDTVDSVFHIEAGAMFSENINSACPMGELNHSDVKLPQHALSSQFGRFSDLFRICTEIKNQRQRHRIDMNAM